MQKLKYERGKSFHRLSMPYTLPTKTRRGKINLEDMVPMDPTDIGDWMKEVLKKTKEPSSKKRSSNYSPKNNRYPSRE